MFEKMGENLKKVVGVGALVAAEAITPATAQEVNQSPAMPEYSTSVSKAPDYTPTYETSGGDPQHKESMEPVEEDYSSSTKNLPNQDYQDSK